MSKNLLIVESPAKAKTIEKILGDDFEVRSCYGHIRDLEKDDMGIDINNNYQPRYIVLLQISSYKRRESSSVTVCASI